MNFTSLLYFFFLAMTLIGFYLIPSKLRIYALLFASMCFYGIVNLGYLILALFIIIFNYYFDIKLENSEENYVRKRILFFIVFINLCILVLFKYLDFLLFNLATLLGIFQIRTSFTIINWALPIGLSYYIFQIIGCSIDIYRGTQKAEKDIAKFSLFILFFPKLSVGPIERAKNLLPQISGGFIFKKENFNEGGKLIIWGLFKKLVIADRINLYTSAVFNNLEYHSNKTIFLATVLYGIQAYADFSGYTDIALGTARLFGIKLINNFNRPFLSQNVTEFWRRWHISLSSWVNDYIYTPIVLKHRNWGIASVYYALFMSFALIGIWHGAKWNYLAFGIIQALAIIFEFSTRKNRLKLSKKIPAALYKWSSIFLTFMFFCFSLVIFRTNTLGESYEVFNRMLVATGNLFIDKPSTILFMIIGTSILIFSELSKDTIHLKVLSRITNNWFLMQVSYAILLILILIAGVFDGGQFIYTQF